MAKEESQSRTVAQNRRANFDYAIEDTIEAGLVLTGTEVKSLRAGQVSINEAYADARGEDLMLINASIEPLKQAHALMQHEPKRPRKLLLKRREVERLKGAVAREGATLVPVAIYFNGRGIAKLKLAIAKGRKAHDKREYVAKRDWEREKSRLMRDKG